MKSLHTYELTDSLQFGKYRGYVLQTVLLQKPKYILWCIKNVDGFRMSSRAWDYAVSIDAAFASFMPTAHKGHNTPVEMQLSDGIEVLTHYPWKDKQQFRRRFMDYARAFAEDVVDLYPVKMRSVSTACQLELQFV